MRQVQFKYLVVLLVAALLGGCGTTPAPDFGGRWKPVNRFAESTTAIPLYSSYVFQASPSDGTLKRMLERWAKDTGVKLDYGINTDYTLFSPVAKVSTTNLSEALAVLNSAYSAQGISISNDVSQISVRASSAEGG